MLIAVDKPSWITSYDVIRDIKKYFPKWTKIWHSGTLDPMATWLLIIWITKEYTKKLNDLQWLDKTYIAEIDFLVDTDTWDLDYKSWITKYKIEDGFLLKDWKKISIPWIDDIVLKLKSLIPSCNLLLPMYSAKKINWQKMYDLARKWEIIQKYKKMKVYDFEILSYEFPYLKLKFDVWSWTYIRSIVYWLWKSFDLWWVLTSLRRTRIWDYNIDDLIFESRFWHKISVLLQ